MKKLARTTVALGFAALALAGCKHNPTSGTVYGMHVNPAHTYTYVTSYCAAYNKYGCTVHIPVVHNQYVPERWEICISADPGADSNTKPSGCLDVDPQTYARFTVGDHYPR